MKNKMKSNKPAKTFTNAQIQAKLRAIDRQLEVESFHGWAGDTNFLSLTYLNFMAYLKGQMLIAIGGDDFDNGLRHACTQYIAWDARNSKRRELARKAGLQDWA